MRELTRQLEFAWRVGQGERRSAKEWAAQFGVRPVSIHRWAGDLRHLGVDIGQFRQCYVIENWEEIGWRVGRWLELEREQEELFGSD